MIARVVLGIGLPVVKDVATNAEERARIVGTYALGNNTLNIKEEGGNLVFMGPGGPQKLKSQGDGRWVPERLTEWAVRFTPETGAVQEIAIDTGDNVMKGKKK
jgi:streptogramin lyase